MSKQSYKKSFTKSLYDDCNLDKKFQETTGPFNWITQNVKESQDVCYLNQSPFMHNNFRSIPSSKIDAESELRNQTRKLSRCPTNKFDPTNILNSKCNKCKNCNIGLPCGCKHCKDSNMNESWLSKNCNTDETGLVPQYTRIKKPCNLPGITINRFQPLCDDLQDLHKIQSNDYIGLNTRLIVKDTFKKSSESLNNNNNQSIENTLAFN